MLNSRYHLLFFSDYMLNYHIYPITQKIQYKISASDAGHLALHWQNTKRLLLHQNKCRRSMFESVNKIYKCDHKNMKKLKKTLKCTSKCLSYTMNNIVKGLVLRRQELEYSSQKETLARNLIASSRFTNIFHFFLEPTIHCSIYLQSNNESIT